MLDDELEASSAVEEGSADEEDEAAAGVLSKAVLARRALTDCSEATFRPVSPVQ
jgi:hypothetical protein